MYNKMIGNSYNLKTEASDKDDSNIYSISNKLNVTSTSPNKDSTNFNDNYQIKIDKVRRSYNT